MGGKSLLMSVERTNRNEQQEVRVVITGMGAITALGLSVADFWQGALEGRSGVGPITKFDTSDYAIKIAASVKDFEPDAFIDKKEAI